MNKKLIAALFAGAFAFASASAIADDKTPSQPVDQAKLKAERDAAKGQIRCDDAGRKGRHEEGRAGEESVGPIGSGVARR